MAALILLIEALTGCVSRWAKHVIVLSILLSINSSATTWTYTENTSGVNVFALGYPVPLPIDSLLPVDGFRSYGNLHARHQDLMLMSDRMTGTIVGQTTNGRDIWAYQLSDANSTTVEGSIIEPAVLQNGGIHAREWSTPEITTAIIERLIENEDDHWLYQYLLENLNIIIQPVENIDGFLQTQRFPNTVLQTQSADDPTNWPRDGRMRRKNMHNVDELLTTEDDGMFGVDLNRNNPPYWNSSNRSSSNEDSIVYHGSSEASEPETNALQAAAFLGPASRLRFYVDTHSFSQLWFVPQTNNQSRNRTASEVASIMRVATNNTYAISLTEGNGGIGSTDEYFAETYQIPSFTLETEPGNTGSVQYGGNGVSHSGFILPQLEINRVRTELTDASIVAWYMQAGPPTLIAVEIKDVDSGTVVYSGQWDVSSPTERVWNEGSNSGLQANGHYQVWAAYNKPMRWLNELGEISNFKSMSVPLAPQFAIEGLSASQQVFNQSVSSNANNWLLQPGGVGVGYLNYASDAFMIDFTLNGSIEPSSSTLLSLVFNNQDFVGKRNDAAPATVVDWSSNWVNYENSVGTNGENGGVDRTLRLIDDNSPGFQAPVSTTSPPNSGSNPTVKRSGGSFEFAVIVVLILSLFRRRI